MESLKNLMRRIPNKALSKLKSLVSFTGKTPTKLTPAKLKTLETYARSNPEKWYALDYYLDTVLGLGFMIFFAGGAIYFGLKNNH